MRRALIFVAVMAIGMSGACAQVIPTDHLPMVPFTQAQVGSGGGGGCAQATTYLARTTSGTEGGNAANITTLICGLVTDGVITGNMSTTGCGATFDGLYIEAQQNSTDALLNLCSTNYTATIQASPVFTSYQGYSFNSPNAYLDTGFNATLATSPNYTQNSGSIGVWSLAVVTEAIPQFSDTVSSFIYDSYTGNLFYARINNAATGSVATPGTKGLFVADRSSSANVIPYWDGVAQTAQSGVSAAPANHNLWIGGVAGGFSGSAQIISETHMGASLGATFNLALYNRLRTYMTAVGVP
jgi:hypothetical protein